MNRDNTQQRNNRQSVYDEAEDRLPQATGSFPPMQTSSFSASMFDVAARNHDNNYSDDAAFGYNEHQQRHHDHHDFGKRMDSRDRSFSHDADELASYGDGSFINEQEGLFAQRNEDELVLDLDLELDFDDLHNLVNELKPAHNKAQEIDDVDKTHYSVVVPQVVTINTANHHLPNDSSDEHHSTANRGNIVDNNVYANEREASDCGTSQQHDHALDSTFHSNGFDEYQNYEEGVSCDELGQDNEQRRFNECSLDNMSLLLDTILAPNRSTMNTKLKTTQTSIERERESCQSDVCGANTTSNHHIAKVEIVQHSPTFINTCADSSSQAQPEHFSAVAELVADAPNSGDQDDAAFWSKPSSGVNESAAGGLCELTRELSINIAFKRQYEASLAQPTQNKMVIDDGSDLRRTVEYQNSADAETVTSLSRTIVPASDISQKMKKLGQIIQESKVKNSKISSSDQKQTKQKKVIQKPEKLQKKEKLNFKLKQPTNNQKKKKAKIIEFNPNREIEEMKANPSKPNDKNSKRPKKGDRNYYQNFDFFFKRTSFRTMTLFFKLAYKPYFDQWRQNKKKYSMLESLIHFTKQEFPGLLDTLSEKARFEFIELVKLLVLSHRHNKNDDFLADPLIDFKIVREPMYKYSKQAQDSFFSMPTYTFLFCWFEASPQGRKFAQEKFAENSESRFPERMISEVSQLGLEAQKLLKQPIFPTIQSIGPSETAPVPPPKSFQNQAELALMANKLAIYFKQSRVKWP